MSPLPLVTIHSRRGHRVDADIDFSEGRLSCTCGERLDVPTEPEFDRNERVALAWQDHRRTAGLRTPSLSDMPGWGDLPQKWSLRSRVAELP